jgi:signal transduction histidine kinase/FixJ family two-component response regulator
MTDHLLTTRHHIIVLDDEPGITRLCKRLLERADFKVTTYTSPNNCLTAFVTQPTAIFRPDLLLVDIRMPGIDGFQMIDIARKSYPDLAVVVMTGFGTVETAIEALRRGADGLILKPFSSEELVQSVRRALEQSQHKQDVLRLQALRPLFDVSESLFTETNPKRLRSLVLEAVCGHLKCPHAEYYQVDMSGTKLEGKQGSTRPRLRLLSSIHQSTDQVMIADETGAKNLTSSHTGGRPATGVLTEPIARESGGLKTPMIINQESSIPVESSESQFQQILRNRGLGSVITAPVLLKAGAIVNGVLLAARNQGEPHFREADLELLVVLARQAAVSLENARLHAELRDYIHQLEDSQRALIQAEKMATAGRLTASIAHEINNPLQAVQNCLHLAGRQELSGEQRQNYLSMAIHELDRLMQTVHRMLDFYRPTAVDRKPVDINALLERVISLAGKQLEDHNIRLHRNLSHNLPPILAVSDQIQQVILNLLLNAMEAMPGGGHIFVELELAGESNFTQKPASEKSLVQREVNIYIEDSGPGINANERKHIFEPFVSTKEQGIGLGLAVSYGIITAHGGSLELVDYHTQLAKQLRSDSPEYFAGNGACFKISLPIAEYT